MGIVRRSAVQLSTVAFALALAANVTRAADTADPLPSWNNGAAKQSIEDFDKKVTMEGCDQFVPQAKRIVRCSATRNAASWRSGLVQKMGGRPTAAL